MLYSVIVNAVIFNRDGKALISRRASKDDHEPGMWTTPGGKVEISQDEHNVLEKSLHREIMEEVGIEIYEQIQLIENNIFTKKDGTKVLALIFCCQYKDGKAMPLDETDEVAWVTKSELNLYNFPPNVKEYFLKGFNITSDGVK